MAGAVLLWKPLPPPEEWLPLDAFPDSDDLPVDSRSAAKAAALLEEGLQQDPPRPDLDIGVNQFLFLDPADPTDFLGPDVWVAVGVAPGTREHWYAWLENKIPEIVIEIISPTSGKRDRGDKYQLYEALGIQEYYYFDLQDNSWRGFERVNGPFADIRLESDGSRISRVLGLKLVLWEGVYQGIRRVWLRWAHKDGTLLLTHLEKQVQEEHLRLRAEEQARVDVRARREAEERERHASAARREAEEREQQEATARREAEEREQQEATARREAEEREQQEAAARREAEERAELAEAELARLRELLASLGRSLEPDETK